MTQDAIRGGVVAFLCLAATTLLVSTVSAADTYATKYGLGPDKWATAWLFSRFVDTDAQLEVIDPDAEFSAGAVPFDDPTADTDFQRTSEVSAFQGVARHFNLDDPIVRRMEDIIYEMEVAFWQTDTSIQTDLVEHGFRRLQEENGRTNVPAECYLKFFDSVASALDAHPKGEAFPLEALVSDCEVQSTDQPRTVAQQSTSKDVGEVGLETVLAAIEQGKRVVFVDVREPSEFYEQHIPGALNIPIRDLDESTVGRIGPADYVVSYCVKDFRGYEMAKLLARAGAQNSVIMNPYGLKGWVSSGLPVAGTHALSSDEADRQLKDCVSDRNCLTR